MKGQASLLSAVLTLACALPVSSQAPVAPHAAAHPGAASQQPLPSSLLQPTLGVVQKTLSTLSFEKWHRGTIRDEASSNVGSMLHDIQENMPPLLKQVDGAPNSVSVAIPVSAHVNALYDVLLRVVEASRVSGPGDQAAALEQALNDMSKARRAFEDRMQQTAAAQEKEISTLRASLTTQAAQRPQTIPVPMVLPCGAFPTRHVVRKKAAAPPAQAKPGSSTPTTPAAAPAQPQKK